MEYLISFINDLATDLFYEKIFINGRELFLRGGCFEFYKIMKYIEPSIELYIHRDLDHCAFLYEGKLYDSTGEVDSNLYRKANDLDISYIEEFFGSALISLNIASNMEEELESIDIKTLVYTKLKGNK